MPIQPNRRRRSNLVITALAVITFLMLGVGFVFTLWVSGVPLAFWRSPTPNTLYMVRIPINVQPISAYSKVTRADLIDPQTRTLRYQLLPPKTAVGMSISGIDAQGRPAQGKVVEYRRHEDDLVFFLDSGAEILHNQTNELGGALMNPSEIIGRVVKKDKTPGLGFQSSAFFPTGTPEGIAGATPPRMRSMILEATRLTGIHNLPSGAYIDLIANVPIDSESDDKTEPLILAQKALVLRSVYKRTDTPPSRRYKPIHEVALALHPGDVIPLQNAINRKLEIICVAHSMRPDNDDNSAWKQIVMAPTDIRAYKALSTSQLEHPHTRRAITRLVRSDDPLFAEALTETELRALVGRVLRRTKPRGNHFTMNDFFPPEIQPGYAANIAPGNTVYAAADDKIEGLAAFAENAHIAILYRGMTNAPEKGVIRHGVSLMRPVASVVVPQARILRASHDGHTLLEVESNDLLRLQAALLTKSKEKTNVRKDRETHLIAVSVHVDSDTAQSNNVDTAALSVADFDPVSKFQILEAFVGRKREMHVFPVETSDASSSSLTSGE